MADHGTKNIGLSSFSSFKNAGATTNFGLSGIEAIPLLLYVI
jgi:hypothetical protein